MRIVWWLRDLSILKSMQVTEIASPSTARPNPHHITAPPAGTRRDANVRNIPGNSKIVGQQVDSLFRRGIVNEIDPFEQFVKAVPLIMIVSGSSDREHAVFFTSVGVMTSPDSCERVIIGNVPCQFPDFSRAHGGQTERPTACRSSANTVPIQQPQLSDSGACKCQGARCADAAKPDDRYSFATQWM
ncbi:hypothetical protein A2G06_02455 [Geobacter anodireducens]|nr:hypothetical protein A2G06_02455 [Geobacter anodireducens]